MSKGDSGSGPYEKWREKLRKELKTNNLDDRKQVLANGVIYDPFLNPDSVSPLSLGGHQSGSVSVMLHSELTGSEHKNQLFKTLLPFDLRAAGLKASADTDWAQVLNGVYPSMLHLDIDFSDDPAVTHFIDFQNLSDDTDQWTVATGQSIPDTTGLKIFHKVDFSRYGFKDQVGVLQEIKDRLAKTTNPLKLIINISDNLFETLPFTRAVQYLKTQSGNGEVLVEGRVDIENGLDNADRQLIAATTAAVWASMSGLDFIGFNPLTDPDQLEHARLLLNIQNLMDLESQLELSEDVLHGAYVVEDLTQQLLSKLH